MKQTPILKPEREAADIIDAGIRYVMQLEGPLDNPMRAIRHADLVAAINRYRKTKWGIG